MFPRRRQPRRRRRTDPEGALPEDRDATRNGAEHVAEREVRVAVLVDVANRSARGVGGREPTRRHGHVDVSRRGGVDRARQTAQLRAVDDVERTAELPQCPRRDANPRSSNERVHAGEAATEQHLTGQIRSRTVCDEVVRERTGRGGSRHEECRSRATRDGQGIGQVARAQHRQTTRHRPRGLVSWFPTSAPVPGPTKTLSATVAFIAAPGPRPWNAYNRPSLSLGCGRGRCADTTMRRPGSSGRSGRGR